MRKNKGFTLTELLVLVAIIAILIALLLPAIYAVIDASKRKAQRLPPTTLIQKAEAEGATERFEHNGRKYIVIRRGFGDNVTELLIPDDPPGCGYNCKCKVLNVEAE